MDRVISVRDRKNDRTLELCAKKLAEDKPKFCDCGQELPSPYTHFLIYHNGGINTSLGALLLTGNLRQALARALPPGTSQPTVFVCYTNPSKWSHSATMPLSQRQHWLLDTRQR